jgi:protein deglycase
MVATLIVPLATGFEEMEAVAVIDTVRRAGIDVIVASVENQDAVEGGHGIVLKADRHLAAISVDEIDMIALPGGWGGTKILAEDGKLQTLLKELDAQKKPIGAICAAPFALEKAGVLKNVFTCYPSVEDEMENDGYTTQDKVVVDGNIITSKGPATAICFGLEIVRILAGEVKKEEVAAGLLADFC